MVALLPINLARRRGCGSCRFVIGMLAMVACADATLPVETRSCCKNAPGMSAHPPECDFDAPRCQAFPPADDNTDKPLIKAKGRIGSRVWEPCS